MPERTRERSFDELAKGLAAGSVSRRKAIRLMGAALVGGALASFPGAAWAAKKGGGGGKSACAKYCKTLFEGDTAAQEECTAQGTKGTGPCFECGGPAKPAPTCSGTQTLNTTTCQCEEGGGVPDLCSGVEPGECGTCTRDSIGYPPGACHCGTLPDGSGTFCWYGGFTVSSCAECANYLGTTCVYGYGNLSCVYPCVNGEPCP